MNRRNADTCLLDSPVKITQESTGLTGPDEESVTGPNRQRPRNRAISMAWISDELLAETIELWSESYGRPISEDEAVEILMNVKRMGELLLKLRKEANET